MKILFFGSISEITGNTEKYFSGNKSVADLLAELEGIYPALKGKKFKVSVNKKIISDFTVLIPEEAEVAILPPFSGG